MKTVAGIVAITLMAVVWIGVEIYGNRRILAKQEHNRNTRYEALMAAIQAKGEDRFYGWQGRDLQRQVHELSQSVKILNERLERVEARTK